MAENFHASKTLTVAIGVATLVATAASPSPAIVLFAGGLLAFGVGLLWSEKDAPLLLLPFGLQWLPVAIKPLETVVLGQPIDDLAGFGGGLTTAAVFALASVGSLAIGLRIGAGPRNADWSLALARDARRWASKDILGLSVGLIVAGHVCERLSYAAGPAVQIVLALSQVRLAALFVLAYWSLLTGEAVLVFAGVAVFEVIFGMTGFFANFRESLLVMAIAAAAARPRLGPPSMALAALAVAGIVVIGAFWSEMKPDYRNFLNEGSGEEVATQPIGERLAYLSNAASEFTQDKFNDGLSRFIDRISYIDFLAKTIQNVPTYIPHQYGRQIGETFLNMIKPRILFPDKPPTPDDTTVTAHFTGLDLQVYSGASISIGYLGELYIDFGFVGGIVGTLLWGMFAGFAFRVIRDFRSTPLLVNYGMATMALIPFSIFETAMIKLVGSVVTVFVVTLALQRYVLPRALPRVLDQRPERAA